MTARDDHFTQLSSALEEAFSACRSGRNVMGGPGVEGFFKRLPDLSGEVYNDKMRPAHRGLCSHIDTVIGAFSDVIDAYVSGDIEQQIRAESESNGDVMLDYPTVRNSDGTVTSEGGTVGTQDNGIQQGRSRVDVNDSSATSPFANHPNYEDNTP